jgi:hypothetical protein
VIFAAVLIASIYKLRSQTIFACEADQYTPDQYISYCNGTRYADYEHGAFWFNLEPSAQASARDADALFLGNSRLQFAFSTVATADWFSAVSARYYLLGFIYDDNVVFAEQVLRRIRPKAKVYVINVDNFFDRSLTVPAKLVMRDPGARSLYEAKRSWQYFHEPLCKTLPLLCGTDFVIFRSRANGAYTPQSIDLKTEPVSYDWAIDDVVKRYEKAAFDFISELPVPKDCIILTTVPTRGTKIGNASAIGEKLGDPLIAPDVPDLLTRDGSHLKQSSAERWSQAFFQDAGSRIRSCLERENTHP